MSHRPRVLITRWYPPERVAPLAARAEVLVPAEEGGCFSDREVRQIAPSLAAIINQGELAIDRALIAAAPQLRIVANAAIGVNNLDLAALRERTIWGTNTPTAFADATADCTLGLLLMLARRLGEADRFVRADRWQAFEPGRWDGILLRGRTLGLVGFGNIGRAVARRAEAFGMQVLHHTRRPTGHPGWRPLDELLPGADFVSLHLPLNPDSRGLINASRLSQMKRGAFLINVARGSVVDEAALLSALRSGQLGGAALDVFADEPRVPPELRTMENVILTPHLGGGTQAGRRLAQEQCVENVRRVLQGERPLPECVVTAA
ncbi:MAG: D-glycerate dehydrogenase [Verrucomicrobia bacterium]|nr:D-glycerate dehydrogenase [Verrucomicrobiota bacterium]